MLEFKSKEELREQFHKVVMPKLVWNKPLTTDDRLLRNEWIKTFEVDINVLKFYSNKNILFEIVKHLENRELCLQMKIRWLLCSKVQFLLYNIYFYRVMEDLKSFYCGLAGFETRQAPPYAIREKQRWQDEYWTAQDNPKYIELMNAYDFAIDLDSDTFMECFGDARTLFEYFNKYKIKFSIWCSGKKGFHIRVPFEEFKHLVKPFSVDNVVAFCKAIALDLKDKLKLNHIDEIIYSGSRYIKCPYSLDSRNKNVIYPLTNEEFINFKEEYMGMDYVLNQKNLGFRGAYCGRESNPKGFEEMVRSL